MRQFAAHVPAAMHQDAGADVSTDSWHGCVWTPLSAQAGAVPIVVAAVQLVRQCSPTNGQRSTNVHGCVWPQGEAVVDVVASTEGRLLVLTEAHVALLRSKAIALRAAYTAAWAVRLTEIQTIRGALRRRLLSTLNEAAERQSQSMRTGVKAIQQVLSM